MEGRNRAPVTFSGDVLEIPYNTQRVMPWNQTPDHPEPPSAYVIANHVFFCDFTLEHTVAVRRNMLGHSRARAQVHVGRPEGVGTLTESAAKSGKLVIGATGRSAADYLDHKYGAEAGNVARDVARIGEKVWVVYFDAMGIRRAVLMAGTKSAVHSLHDARAAAAATPTKGDGSVTFKAPDEKSPAPAAATTPAQPEQTLSETMGPAIILGNKVLVSLASAASSLAKASSEWVAANVQQPPLPPREKS
ncbi:hypothetical protein AMAG_19309 [Allomyces macrogynus ATCC 38327]|uniref:Senescence domain-containing protein n=1 Tax=Allomyces macrogynus (strain ATCC 38327) TaxID=578462 RepID=A0A0L0SUJ3_ALLM3|nr:hypothetical protein AMAG_19309 [Allomyces macrogynus ATCC 38327]|eukprot:KNE65994.1 hypothetical protein AMAG_19309 [Allomyces macrogynus ATCC 38327]